MEKPKKKLWGGRFSGGTAGSVEAFTASIDVDARLYRHDISGSIAHAKMLGKQRIIPPRTRRRLSAAWQAVEREIDSGKFAFSQADEDIHMNIERRLTEKIGAAGGKLHTARSRNDQVALDMRLYLRDEVKTIIDGSENSATGACPRGKKHLDVIMPGYTHLQRAQPVLLVASSAGLLRHVRARLRALCRFSGADQRFAAWAPARWRARLFRSIGPMSPSCSGFPRDFEEQHRRGERSRFSLWNFLPRRRFFLFI